MKLAPLLLLCASSLGAQSPPSAPTGLQVGTPTPFYPTNSTILLSVFTGTGGPFGFTHQGFAAYWQTPDTNVWLPEISTNGLDWSHAGNQWSAIAPRPERTTNLIQRTDLWNYTETSTNWTPTWQVRIRRIK